MHRKVNSESVIQFMSNELNRRPVGIFKSEVVEYKRGTMQSSSGTVKITVNGPVQPSPLYGESISDELPTYDESFGTSELSGSGQYSLKLEKCYPKPSVVRRSTIDAELTESSIFATVHNGNHHPHRSLTSMHRNNSCLQTLSRKTLYLPPSCIIR